MDMLTFSKEREPDPVAAEMNTVVGDVIELMQTRAQELAVTLEWKPAPKLPTLVFDPEGLHRAVLNVITNAIDACDGVAGGRVEVCTRLDRERGLVEVVVEDNGGGIPAEDLENIFSVFVSRKGSRGTGLGLPVSQKIMKEHGGQIQVESEVGHGSRFILQLAAVYPDRVKDTGIGTLPPG